MIEKLRFVYKSDEGFSPWEPQTHRYQCPECFWDLEQILPSMDIDPEDPIYPCNHDECEGLLGPSPWRFFCINTKASCFRTNYVLEQFNGTLRKENALLTY